MKVLIATFTYPPNADGVAEASAVLARGLAAHGHEVQVVTAFHSDRRMSSSDNPRVAQFRIEGNGVLRGGVQGDIGAYQEFLLASDADVMVFECWDMWPMHAARPILARINAVKVLVSHCYTAHQWLPHPKFPWGLGTWFRGLPAVLRTPWTLRKFDQLVVLSRRAGFDRFFDHRIAKITSYSACSVIPNGAYAHEFKGDGAKFRETFGIGPGPLVLCVANYSERKNQELALRAFRQAAVTGATLVFIGSEYNHYSDRLSELEKQLSKNLPIGDVRILERVGRELTCSAYCAADLFLLSAKQETQPIVLLEAMASRTPWVSTNTGCVAELPGGVVVHSEKAMAGAIRHLLQDSAARSRLMESGWQACRTTYDWERVVDSYEELFLRLVRGKSGG